MSSPVSSKVAPPGILLCNSKDLLGYTFDYGITCSYDEVLRFRRSSAVDAAHNDGTKGVLNPQGGLIQVIVDNYNANINSLNGKKSTHALAMIVTQPGSANDPEDGGQAIMIRQLSRQEMKEPIADYEADDDEDDMQYVCHKTPLMPDSPQVRDNEFEDIGQISEARAVELDFQFFHDIISKDNIP